MKSTWIIGISLIVLVLLGACGPSAEVVAGAVNETLVAMPTQTSFPTYTPIATYTPLPTYTALPTLKPVVLVVTATHTSTPQYTPTITSTPTNTNTPAPTLDLTQTDKVDGSYMVGSEIAPGIWRSTGGSPDEECWLTVKTFSGDLEDITGELPGATIRIPAGEHIVYIGGGSGNKCTWTFLSP